MKQKQYILHSLAIEVIAVLLASICLLYTSPSPRDRKRQVAGFDDCISSMQDIWHTNEFTSICYGYRVCHTKTHISSLYYRGKIYYRSHPSIILGISQEKSQ